MDSVSSSVPPTLALEQRLTRGGGTSTVATVTEVAHYLRLLYARIGVASGEGKVFQARQTAREAARMLGVARSTLYRMLVRHRIS